MRSQRTMNAVATVLSLLAGITAQDLVVSQYAFMDENNGGANVVAALLELLLAAALVTGALLAHRSSLRLASIALGGNPARRGFRGSAIASLALVAVAGYWLPYFIVQFAMLMGWMFVDYGDPDHPGHLKGAVVSKPWFVVQAACIAALLYGAWRCSKAAYAHAQPPQHEQESLEPV